MDATTKFFAYEYLILGLTVFINPDFFWNPKTGVLKAMSGAGDEMPLDETNHFDTIFKLHTISKGAAFLSLSVMFFMSSSNPMKKTDCHMTGFYADLFLFLIYFYAVQNPDSFPAFNLPNIGLYTGIFLTHVMWHLVEVLRIRLQDDDTLKRTPAPRPQVLLTLLKTFNLVAFGAMAVFMPHCHDPDGFMPFWVKTSLPGTALNAAHVFQNRCQGAFILAFGCIGIQALLLDRSKERIRWLNQCSYPSFIIYLVLFIRAALDTTGYTNKTTWVTMTIVQCVFPIVSLILIPPAVLVEDDHHKWLQKAKANLETSSKIKSDKVPDLTVEVEKKVQ